MSRMEVGIRRRVSNCTADEAAPHAATATQQVRTSTCAVTMADKDVLSNMFSSFVSRKTRTWSPQLGAPMSPTAMSLSPVAPLPLLPHMAHLCASASGGGYHASYGTSNNNNGGGRAHCTMAAGMHAGVNMISRMATAAGDAAVKTAATEAMFSMADGSGGTGSPIELQHSMAHATKGAAQAKQAHPHDQQKHVIERSSRTRQRDDAKDRDGASHAAQAKSARRTRSRTSRVSTSNASRSVSKRRVGNNGSSGNNSKGQDKDKDKKHGTEHGGHGTASSSVRGVTGSAGSVEAIATDSTAVATPFHCDKCSKAFRQRSQLSRHYLRVHERKKPFGCAHCDKHFASAFDRKRHVEAVHGRRCIEFFCDRCSFRSKQESELEQHIRSTHERDHCLLCGKTFKRAANLVAHERHYHSNNNNDLTK